MLFIFLVCGVYVLYVPFVADEGVRYGLAAVYSVLVAFILLLWIVAR